MHTSDCFFLKCIGVVVLMSSRSGPRATGTDGSDFTHRERVASHYKSSVLNKSRLKSVALLHTLLFGVMAVACSESVLKMFSVKPPAFILDLHLPKSEPWQYAWLTSIVATIFGLLSLSKNTTILLQQYIIGTLVFGCGPVVYGVYIKGFQLLEYITTRKSQMELFGFPIIVVLFMFFTVAIQVHGFGIYFAIQLLRAWKPKGKEKTK